MRGGGGRARGPLILLVPALLITACATAPPRARSAPSRLVEPIDDTDLHTQLVQGARLLHEAGRTVPMRTLIGQLSRRRHALRLPPTRREPMSNARLYARARRAVLVIGNLYKCPHCGRWHVGEATGFVIAPGGIAVTGYHVIDRPDNATLVAMTADGQVRAVREVLAASRRDDLAVLRIDLEGGEGLVPGDPAAPGDPVRVVSHPDGEHYALTAGIVSRVFTGRRGGRPVAVLQITAGFAKGSSGAPVLDAAGNVVGVVSYTRSIYHDDAKGGRGNLQMVMHNTVPAGRLRALLGASAP